MMPPLHLLILKCTDGCNLQCRICSYWRTAAPKMLSVESVHRITDGLSDELPPFALITGGEPLIVPWIKSIVSHLVEKYMRVALCANGMLITRHAGWMAELLDELFISIWDVTPQLNNLLRGRDSWERMIHGVEVLGHYSKRPRIILRWTVMPENITHLPRFPLFAKKLNIDGISIQPADIKTDAFGSEKIRPVWQAGSVPKETIVESINEFYHNASETGILEQDEQSVRRTREYILAACGYKMYSRASCNAPERSVVINPDLTVAPCYFLPALGDIQAQKLSEFRSSTYLHWLTGFNPMTAAGCGTCVCSRIYEMI